MIRKLLTIFGLTALAGSTLLADFSYQETTTITGGALAGMLKIAGVFSKSAREPVRSTVFVKGDRMVHRGNNDMQIIDLASETITSVDLQKKTYTVMTFAQMKEMIEKASQELSKSKDKDKDKKGADIKWTVTAEPTGNSRQFAGYDAKEMLLTMTMEGTDQKSGEKGSMVVNTRLWLAPDVAGYQELRDFQKRMATKLNWTPRGNIFAAQPELAQGMSEAAQEMSKLQGVPVFQTMVMGAEGVVPAEGPKSEKPDQGNKPSIGGALGGALGGRFGLGKKKQEPPPPPADSAAAANQGAMIEMETEFANFSTSAIDGSQFSVPAGFKQVEMKK